MPELPEVEHCRRILLRRRGTLLGVEVRDPAALRTKLSTHPSEIDAAGEARVNALIGAKTDTIARHGKRIGWWFADRDTVLLVHLGMTGKWTLDAHEKARVVFRFSDGPLSFVDSRRFGSIAFVSEVLASAALKDGHGPDALLETPTASALRAALRGVRPVKVALMDQAVLAGLGNIHASEILWQTRVHPGISCNRLTDAQVAAIVAALPAHLEHYVKDAASEDEIAYLNQGGPNPFRVYDRAGEPCPRCGAPIASDRHAGRSTYFCPSCQSTGDAGAAPG
jgi:formamidopyrimidine-DNA glycosylase